MLVYRSDPEVARYQYWEPYTIEKVASVLDNQVHVQPGMFGVPLLLVAEYEGRIVGDVSIAINIPEHFQGEIGISFNQAYAGRGLATRALSAVLGFGFVQLGLHRITMATFTDNDRAWQLMERVGMRREAHFIHDGFVRARWVNVYGYGMLADEWQERYPHLIASVSP